MSSGKMKFIDFPEPGDANVLTISETDIPQPKNGQVLIKVEAAGVNRLDILQRRGFYPEPPGASNILGVEVAGTITSVSENCSGLTAGDRVCALLPGGGYAQYAVADAPTCLPIPHGLDMIEAASLPEVMFTVWNNLIDIGQLAKGDTILIHGGASGVGSAAIQLASCMDAKVFITARNEKKCQYCQSLGADITINYQTQDFVQVCLDHTSEKGINLILDMVGGDYLAKNIKAAARGAKIIMIAAVKGIKSEVNILSIMQKQLVITGSTLRSRDIDYKEKICRNLKNNVWPLIESGKIKPSIYEIFPLDQAEKAHLLMESNQHCGKIMLDLSNM